MDEHTAFAADGPKHDALTHGDNEAGPLLSTHVSRKSRRANTIPWLSVLFIITFSLYLIHTTASGPSRHVLGWFTNDASSATTASPGEGDQYLLGVGKADITGPVVEVNMMGYADPKQLGTGLRQRLYSRAFIVGATENPADRFVYLVLDTQSGDTAVRYGILSGLRDLGPEYDVYQNHNIAVTGTHSHSGPAGWLNYLLPQITSKGFDRQGYRAIVDGAVRSIVRAHESLQPGHLSIGSTRVDGANINRSLFAYLANPEEERAKYNISGEDDGSVEKNLTLLRFQRASDGKNIGVLTWFPTHGTSMYGNNTIITGDNKGVAAYLFEKSAAKDPSSADGFVAGFSQADVGDTSPNVLGAYCEDGSGELCSFENSTCPSDGRSQKCHARGPLYTADDTGTSSCFEIGRRQFMPAKSLYDELNANPIPVQGPWVKSFHTFHNMSEFKFHLPNGSLVSTCPAALGWSFAAGTSDGPGAFDFTQHDGDPSNTSPVWRVVSGFLKEPSDEQRACQGAKPILLDVGEVYKPYAWTPNVVDIQVFRVGQLLIVVSPGEATTMAGRRWKEAVREESVAIFSGEGEENNHDTRRHAPSPVVVLGGPANSYTHYIATEQEYSIQRYEGASTLYGPHTLAAYINVTLSHLPLLGARVPSGSLPRQPPEAFPPDNTNRSLSFITGVVRDGTPLGRGFGEVKQDVRRFYRVGSDVLAVFVGANPRNDLRLGRTYAAVEKLVPGGGGGRQRRDGDEADGELWQTIRDDSDWALVFRWKRTSEVLATSEVEITWETDREPEGERPEPGVYRIRYYGDWKSIGGTITPFEGVTGAFTLV